MLKNPLDGCIGNIIEAMASLMIFVVRTRFVLCVLLAGAFSDAFAEPVHIQLRWHHQFQFAGYYVALEKGFYRKAGLEVILDAGSPDKKAGSASASGACPIWRSQ